MDERADGGDAGQRSPQTSAQARSARRIGSGLPQATTLNVAIAKAPRAMSKLRTRAEKHDAPLLGRGKLINRRVASGRRPSVPRAAWPAPRPVNRTRSRFLVLIDSSEHALVRIAGATINERREGIVSFTRQSDASRSISATRRSASRQSKTRATSSSARRATRGLAGRSARRWERRGPIPARRDGRYARDVRARAETPARRNRHKTGRAERASPRGPALPRPVRRRSLD